MNHLNPSIKNRLKQANWEIKPIAYYLDGIIGQKDYYILSECITLLESSVAEHRNLALKILQECYNHRVPSIRYGITGSPGVGKSTFIDSIARSFMQNNHKVGVLTVDPSSIETKGSILGDKTRMDHLIQDKDIFIRPSPSSLYLGGLNQFTFEAIILCEAAGLDRIFIETVGIGQSEVDVSNHTDATILLVLPGSGDSLQGIKKGILEKADLVIINKSDGASAQISKTSAKDYRDAIHVTHASNAPEVLNYSSLTGENKEEVLKHINQIISPTDDLINQKRNRQEAEWLNQSLKDHIQDVIILELEKYGLENIIKSNQENESPFDLFAKLKNKLDLQIKFRK